MNIEEIVKLAQQVQDEGFAPVGIWPEVRRLCELAYAAGAAAAKAEEREACAKVCEQEWNDYCGEPSGYALAVKECANAIRARKD